MKNERFTPPALGGTPLLMSLAVLLLTVLTLLSLGQARADRLLAAESAKNIEEFYAADMEAEKILALLRNGLPVEGVTLKDGIYSYSCAVSAYQTLFVEVDGETWEILRWETVTNPERSN